MRGISLFAEQPLVSQAGVQSVKLFSHYPYQKHAVRWLHDTRKMRVVTHAGTQSIRRARGNVIEKQTAF